jgi:hypothetical protein
MSGPCTIHHLCTQHRGRDSRTGSKVACVVQCSPPPRHRLIGTLTPDLTSGCRRMALLSAQTAMRYVHRMELL